MDYLFYLSAFVTFVTGIICSFIGGSINSSKGRSYGEGFAFGLFLGFIGLIIIAILPKNEYAIEQLKLSDGTSKICPYCAEIIKREAIVCKHCGKDISGSIMENGNSTFTKMYGKKSEIPRYKTCLKCFHSNPMTELNCEECGARLEQIHIIEQHQTIAFTSEDCPKCGNLNSANTTYCQFCGESLRST